MSAEDPTTLAPAPAKPKRAYNRLTDAQKTEGTTLYRAGTHTVDEIVAKLGGAPDTWRKHFLKLKVKKGDAAKEVEAKRAAVMQEALTLDPAVHARRVFDTKNDTYRIVDMLRKLTVKTVVACQQEGKPLGSIQNDLKSIREAAQSIKTLREEAFAVLGIKVDDAGDEQLPELVIAGLDEDQIADLQSANEDTEIPDLPDELGDDE